MSLTHERPTWRLGPDDWDEGEPVRSLAAPHMAPNPYIGHRLTLRGRCRFLACDCGREYDTAAELEAHQQRYRHPKVAS